MMKQQSDMNKTFKRFFPVTKPAFTLIEVLVSLLIVSMVGISCIYITSGYLKNTHSRDIRTMELIKNIDTVEKIKAGVKTKGELEEFSDNHNGVILSEISDNLYKVMVGWDRKLTVVIRTER